MALRAWAIRQHIARHTGSPLSEQTQGPMDHLAVYSVVCEYAKEERSMIWMHVMSRSFGKCLPTPGNSPYLILDQCLDMYRMTYICTSYYYYPTLDAQRHQGSRAKEATDNQIFHVNRQKHQSAHAHYPLLTKRPKSKATTNYT
jgi:hypothetical protein